MQLPYYILTVIGLGYFLTLSDLMKPYRVFVSSVKQKEMMTPIKFLWDKFDGVVNCIYCASFWIGIVVYYAMFRHFSIHTVFYAFSAMGSIYVIKNLFHTN
jgi:hypothetical protein